MLALRNFLGDDDIERISSMSPNIEDVQALKAIFPAKYAIEYTPIGPFLLEIVLTVRGALEAQKTKEFLCTAELRRIEDRAHGAQINVSQEHHHQRETLGPLNLNTLKRTGEEIAPEDQPPTKQGTWGRDKRKRVRRTKAQIEAARIATAPTCT